VSDIMAASGVRPRTRTLDAAKALADNGIITVGNKRNGENTYGKDPFYRQHREKILSLAGNPAKLKKFPTKSNPQIIVNTPKIRFPKPFFVRAQQITVDDLDSFRKVKQVHPSTVGENPLREEKFKNGVRKVLGESGRFQDWGGEKNDLFTTRMKILGRRVATAVAFKGPGKKAKKLTPKMMGKNGDQIQRLFSSAAADAYLLQYWRQIDEAVVEQMKMLALAKSALERKPIRFGVIDGTDSARLIKAYPNAFK
jgi:hypothetical protein